MCFVCQRIELIKQGKNKYFVRELQTGYVVMGDYQRFNGYTLFLCKEHASELHYELLGVGDAVHMHWHLFPRKEGDTKIPGPVWKLSAEEMYDCAFIPDSAKLKQLKNRLNQELDILLET